MISVVLLITLALGFISTPTPCAAFALVTQQQVLHAHGTEYSPPLKPIAVACAGYAFPHVICMHRYGCLIKGDFEKKSPHALCRY